MSHHDKIYSVPQEEEVNSDAFLRMLQSGRMDKEEIDPTTLLQMLKSGKMNKEDVNSDMLLQMLKSGIFDEQMNTPKHDNHMHSFIHGATAQHAPIKMYQPLSDTEISEDSDASAQHLPIKMYQPPSKAQISDDEQDTQNAPVQHLPIKMYKPPSKASNDDDSQVRIHGATAQHMPNQIQNPQGNQMLDNYFANLFNQSPYCSSISSSPISICIVLIMA